MDTSRIVGQSVTHISYGAGKIVSANDKQIQVQFESGELKKYQYPQAFISYLQIDDKSLMSEILIEEQIRKQKEDEEKKKLREKREIEQQGVDVSSIATGKKQTRNRSTSKTEPRSYDGVILDRNTSYITHAETLNTCFGYHYVHFQKAYKDLDNGYAVWFPRIAKKVGTDYLSSDSYWGWLNIMSEDGDTIIQMDNPDFPYSGEGPDKNMRIIFARFEGDNKYRFVGIYKFEKRISNGEIFIRIGTKLDTKTMKIVE